jgi:hypothetical protein
MVSKINIAEFIERLRVKHKVEIRKLKGTQSFQFGINSKVFMEHDNKNWN